MIKQYPIQDYHLSFSSMKHFEKSPRHFLHYKHSPKEQTNAMLEGTQFHTYMLEIDKFEDEYKVCPNFDKRTTKGKEGFAQWQIDNIGKKLIEQDQFDMIKRMHEALYDDPMARELMEEITHVERFVKWKDDVTGVELHGRIDMLSPEITIDLKSTVDADPDSFRYTAFKEYLKQPALYVDGREILGMKKGTFYFIAVEKKEPYGVSVMKCTKSFIQHGRQEYMKTLEDFAHWKAIGCPNVGYEWHAPMGYHSLDVPKWIR